MLQDILLILGFGYFGGEFARRLKTPPLIAMIFAGIILGNQVTNLLSNDILQSADNLRVIAVVIILMKAGLGLDRQKLRSQGSVALRLGILPALGEVIAVSVLAVIFLDFDWVTGLLLGCILGAESPAVIVPGMLRLKSLGWGVKKGIPDAILTGSALSDVLLLLIFSLLMGLLTNDGNSLEWQWLPLQFSGQIIGGVVIGWLASKILVWLIVRQKLTQNTLQETMVTGCLALLLVIISEKYHFFSGYLGVMSTGFFLIEFSPPLARCLRNGFDSLWQVAQIFLFVLLGATIPLNVLGSSFGKGLTIIILGTLVGRMAGWYLSTWKSNWNQKEKLFLLAGNSAKATVQAAIASIPLAQGITGGEEILAIAALSILVTAPLGAWAIPTFAPLLLTKGEVDPTKVSVDDHVILLSAIDDSPLTTPVLKKTAEIARRSNAEVIVLHILDDSQNNNLENLKEKINTLLADINHQVLIVEGVITEEILRVSQEFQVKEIIMGKRGHKNWHELLIGSVSQTVLESSPIPVIIVEH
ncbi:cation:proton antiporter [Cyanobacterium aponinum FACHB-4101]|uniref:cation:proton antiporter n=1 Tax=Cyanobacterium aponinum TaxID=379064 RepID=UPI00168010E4|nr:cation:proton antiporter [Cyanobacterium aponinum]MBD2394814.1 cation:proton antiporter [Cyanobacterium aponinum FACHB-4101]